MKTAFAVIVVVIICILATGCYAQSTSRFQSVGGEYGQGWISTFKANNPQPTKESGNGSELWKWGSAPKGSMVVDGNLIADPRYLVNRLNGTSNWLGDTLVDPYDPYAKTPVYTFTDPRTGETVYVYTDPVTGLQYYTYKDAKTGKLYNVYVDATGQPTDVRPLPTSSGAEEDGFALPPIFSSGTAWS